MKTPATALLLDTELYYTAAATQLVFDFMTWVENRGAQLSLATVRLSEWQVASPGEHEVGRRDTTLPESTGADPRESGPEEDNNELYALFERNNELLARAVDGKWNEDWSSTSEFDAFLAELRSSSNSSPTLRENLPYTEIVQPFAKRMMQEGGLSTMLRSPLFVRDADSGLIMKSWLHDDVSSLSARVLEHSNSEALSGSVGAFVGSSSEED